MTVQRAILSAPILSVLSACAPASVPAAMPKSAVLALDGIDYQAVQGADLVLTRANRLFGYDEGLLAKRVAEANCAENGRRLAPASLGRFQAGAWVFAGGCA